MYGGAAANMQQQFPQQWPMQQMPQQGYNPFSVPPYNVGNPSQMPRGRGRGRGKPRGT